MLSFYKRRYLHLNEEEVKNQYDRSKNDFIGFNALGGCCGYTRGLPDRMYCKGLLVSEITGEYYPLKYDNGTSKIVCKVVKRKGRTYVFETFTSTTQPRSGFAGKRESLNTVVKSDFVEVAVGQLYYTIEKALKDTKVNVYNQRTFQYDQKTIKKASESEWQRLRRELRAAIKGKFVVLTYQTVYQKKQIEAIRKHLKVFNKKPVYKTTWNNLNHPENSDYLTVEAYQY
jgi:hypothetical protein